MLRWGDWMIKHENRGGLIYPSDKLVHLVSALRRYLDVILERMKVEHPLTEAVKNAVPVLLSSEFFPCTHGDASHKEEPFQLFCTKLFKPLLVNFANSKTDLSRLKYIFEKPHSRKLLKVCGVSTR